MYWYTLDIFLNRGSYFIITLYIAKIIGPTEFGLVSILSVIYYLGLAISDSGMSNSLMRTDKCDDTDYGTVLVANLIFGFFIYLLLFVSTPFISEFYNSYKITKLLPVYAIGILLSSFKSVYIAYMMKNFKYKLMFFLNLPGNFISLLLALFLINKGLGIWSIIYLFLSNQLISLIMFYMFSGWKTKYILNFNKFKFHFGFGYKLSISAVINTFFENINQLIIGKYFSVRQTGLFDRSFALGNYPISILSTVISKVTLPLFVNFSQSVEIFKKKFQETIKLISFLTCFVSGIIFLVVPYLIRYYMGNEWIESIRIFEILILGLLFYPIHAINLNILNVYGRSDIFLILELLKKTLQVFIILLFYHFGIYGLIYGFVFLSVASLLINLYYTQHFIKYTIIKQLSDVLPNLFTGFISIVISKYIVLNIEGKILLLGIQVLIFILSYISFSFFSNKLAITHLRKLFLSFK
jgi:O-antigen/teichoic acid export membrane protein